MNVFGNNKVSLLLAVSAVFSIVCFLRSRLPIIICRFRFILRMKCKFSGKGPKNIVYVVSKAFHEESVPGIISSVPSVLVILY